MTFQKEFFEELSDNVDREVYFTNKSSLKPSGLNIINFKFPELLEFILHEGIYLPKLWRSMLPLIHIHQQTHSIHMEIYR